MKKGKDLEITAEDMDIFDAFQADNPHLFNDANRDYSDVITKMKKMMPSDLDLLSAKTDPMPYMRKKVQPQTAQHRANERAAWAAAAQVEVKTPLTYKGARDTIAHMIQNYCQNNDLAKFDYDQYNICAIQNVMRYFLHDVNGKYKSKKGLWIYGTMGSGKTLLADLFSAFTRHFNLPKKFQVISAEQVADQVRTEKSLNSIGKYFQNINYCFDDVGQERVAKIYKEEEDVMQKIILKAYREKKTLIVTSNLAPKNVAEALKGSGIYSIESRYEDERTVDRIYEMFNFVPLLGSNKRRIV
jgi:DNA replication protein DnaC